jgi:sigma-B regulation protein RsbU (phosphoserine phosphatase)
MELNFPESGNLLANLMNTIPDMIYFKDRQSRFIKVNQACADRHGWASVDAVEDHSDFDVFTKAHAQQAYEDEQRIIQTGEPLLDAEEKETWPDGSVTWVSTTKVPLKDNKGEIVGTFGISRDITERKNIELRAANYDKQIRTIKGRMEEDARMAGDLQKTFFPRSYPSFGVENSKESSVEFLHHYRASGIVSGDFCSVRRLSETKAGIFLCDVMGHGVRAALGTALICAMVEELSALEHDPGAFLGRMNELLLPILRQDDMFLYATACYMVFDAASGTLRYANAGHPVPLLFPQGQGPAQWLMDDPTLRGPALAIAEGAEYLTQEKVILSGQSVVMYTDGLYEVESPEGEELGEDRLLSAAAQAGNQPLKDLFPSLISIASEFAGEIGLNDDVCLVGFTFHNPM